jgi:hypothetical protein
MKHFKPNCVGCLYIEDNKKGDYVLFESTWLEYELIAKYIGERIQMLRAMVWGGMFIRDIDKTNY